MSGRKRGSKDACLRPHLVEPPHDPDINVPLVIGADTGPQAHYAAGKRLVLWSELARAEMLVAKEPVAPVLVDGWIRPESVRVDVAIFGLENGLFLLHPDDPFACEQGDWVHVSHIDKCVYPNHIIRSRMPEGWYRIVKRKNAHQIYAVPKGMPDPFTDKGSCRAMATLTLAQLESELTAGRSLDLKGQLDLVRRLRTALVERDQAQEALATAGGVTRKRDDESPVDLLRRAAL